MVNGGPHKGNTWLLTEEAKRFLTDIDGDIIFSEVHLSDIGLPFCTGCSSCFRRGHWTCPHSEKVQPVMDMIEDSDGVIFSVPCFQGHLPGILKNFTDHMAFMLHRPRYFTKKALVITTTGGVSARGTTKAMAAVLSGWGFNKCYQLPIMALSWNDYRPSAKDLKKTHDIAGKFYADISSGKLHVPGAGVLIPFNLFQAMTAAETDYPTEDNSFWPKYAGMRYAPGIPLTPGKKLLGWLIYQAGRRLLKSTTVTYRK
ncbi:flavodoxin family protein [Acutalibacter sp. 1XD8-36]|uniref:flavodoxin family protein n=1 Tax=Acutalibacter sp. 1XD8-36 TaxID=2320852 RepID=UPI002625ABE9|nr:NAD(P)H-dependent oxidoreductase [Acutalibacter sp. 1XD8-36]